MAEAMLNPKNNYFDKNKKEKIKGMIQAILNPKNDNNQITIGTQTIDDPLCCCLSHTNSTVHHHHTITIRVIHQVQHKREVS
jgi:hypothetical protein